MFFVWVFFGRTLVSRFFLKTMIVSRYCLKFLFSKNCSQCKKGALVKNNLSVWDCNCCYLFLDSKSFFMSVSRWHFILKSMKVYFAKVGNISQIYLFFSWSFKFFIPPFMFRLVLLFAVLLLCVLLSIVVLLQYWCVYIKQRFFIFFNESFGRCWKRRIRVLVDLIG